MSDIIAVQSGSFKKPIRAIALFDEIDDPNWAPLKRVAIHDDHAMDQESYAAWEASLGMEERA